MSSKIRPKNYFKEILFSCEDQSWNIHKSDWQLTLERRSKPTQIRSSIPDIGKIKRESFELSMRFVWNATSHSQIINRFDLDIFSRQTTRSFFPGPGKPFRKIRCCAGSTSGYRHGRQTFHLCTLLCLLSVLHFPQPKNGISVSKVSLQFPFHYKRLT